MTTFLRLLQYVHAYRARLGLALFCSVGVAGFQAVYAWLVQPLMDGILIQQDQYWFNILPLIILGVALLKASFGYGQAYLMSYVGNWIVADVRHQLFLQIVRLPVKYHDTNASGRLVARVLNDVNEMANAIPSIMKDLFQQGLTFLALLGVVFYQNWKLATVMLFIIPASALVIVRIGKRLRKLSTRGQESMGDMANVLKETFAGVRLVKAYGGEESEVQRFDVTNRAYRSASQKAAQVSALSSPLMEIIGLCGTVVIIWYGGHLISIGAMTPGGFSSFFAAMFMAYAPIRRLSGANQAIQRALAASKRVFDVLDLETEFDRDAGKAELPPIRKSLEFRHVTFSYPGSEQTAVRQFSLTIPVGEVVALVGSSGSGKSTLVSLVPRFYRPSEGMILIDGHDVREASRASLRRQIGIVSQETVLFDDTIRHNIAYGRPTASDEQVIEAAQLAFAWEFIQRLPNQLDTRVGEDGVKLSGGQRQRLAIARAILRNPPLLILDEATSALDSESEKLVQAALKNLMNAQRTTLVIAHRLSTVQHADRIVVLAHGSLIAVGSHAPLLEKGGVYTRLYHTQFEHFGIESLESNRV